MRLDGRCTLFVRGYEGENVLGWIEAQLNMRLTHRCHCEQRAGFKGLTYRIICDGEETASEILKKKGRLKGSPVWLDVFKTGLEREIERNRREWRRAWDSRIPENEATAQRRLDLHERFLFLRRKLERLE